MQDSPITLKTYQTCIDPVHHEDRVVGLRFGEKDGRTTAFDA